MSQRKLIIEGARQNNLKNISLSLPHNKIIAITGVSGSGKSSLAFDTIFAEGQWRFIESLSTYARLFLEKLDRPVVDAIHNIRPAIALEQKNPTKGSRSTVGTLTEIYDFLRLLYSKVSSPFCPQCKKEVRKWDTSQIARHLAENYADSKALIIFDSESPLSELRERGYQRFLINGRIADIEDAKDESPPFSIVLDRLVIRQEPRLADSVETAWREGSERLKILLIEKNEMLEFASLNACSECGIELPEPSPLLFSFNHPLGACAKCRGFGNILKYDEKLIIPDEGMSLSEGAIEPWNKPAYRWWKKQMLDGAKRSCIDTKKPFNRLPAGERQKIFSGDLGFYGIEDFFKDLEGRRYKLHVRVFLSRYRTAVACPDCNGKRLQKNALAYKISGHDIAEACGMPISGLIKFFKHVDLSPFQRDIAKEALRQVEAKLSFLSRVGVDYLTLNRPGRTLSGGEYQRVNLSNQLASSLTGTLYVLDEPTVGLHARDTEKIAKIMSELSGIGNTIVVVEHDKAIIDNADWVVELGPGGGKDGGNIVFTGSKEQFLKAGTPTSRYISGADKITSMPLISAPQKDLGRLALFNARGNNLKGVDLNIPLQTLTVVTGVSGSGKSSLIIDTLYKTLAAHFGTGQHNPLPCDSVKGIDLIKGLSVIDQTPIGKSPRSNPATYMKVFDSVRKLFSAQAEARARGYGSGFFSFNVPGGRCEACKGEGYQKLEMYFFEDIYMKCEDCDGKRFNNSALLITYKGKNIDDVLNMTVDEACELFSDIVSIHGKLAIMRKVGLGYLRIGQPVTTLSGGEVQRLKICSELSSGKNNGVLYILDEPTVGLHFRDVKLLISVLGQLVKAGNTVVVIEHNLDLISASDWIIDMGPEGGDRGGAIIFEGTPQNIVNIAASHTGRFLKKQLTARA